MYIAGTDITGLARRVFWAVALQHCPRSEICVGLQASELGQRIMRLLSLHRNACTRDLHDTPTTLVLKGGGGAHCQGSGGPGAPAVGRARLQGEISGHRWPGPRHESF